MNLKLIIPCWACSKWVMGSVGPGTCHLTTFSIVPLKLGGQFGHFAGAAVGSNQTDRPTDRTAHHHSQSLGRANGNFSEALGNESPSRQRPQEPHPNQTTPKPHHHRKPLKPRAPRPPPSSRLPQPRAPLIALSESPRRLRLAMEAVRASAAWVASRSSHVKVDMLGMLSLSLSLFLLAASGCFSGDRV